MQPDAAQMQNEPLECRVILSCALIRQRDYSISAVFLTEKEKTRCMRMYDEMPEAVSQC